jgi:hypothetical protein
MSNKLFNLNYHKLLVYVNIFLLPVGISFSRSHSARHQTQTPGCLQLNLLPALHTKTPDNAPKFSKNNRRFDVRIFINKAVRDRYLAKIPRAKDTDFLSQEITSRYNVTTTTVPVSP